MGRAKGKERKEHKRPFVAKVKVSEDIVGDNFTFINVTVTLETKVGEMKRRIAAAKPTLRADRIEIVVCPKASLDDDEKTLADCELNKDSVFVLFTLEKLTVQTPERSFTLLVTTNQQIRHTKMAIERRDSDLPAAKMVLVHKGAVLRNDDSLLEIGIAEGSVVGCLVRRPEQAQREARRFWKMARRLCDFCGKQGRISKPTFPRCSLCSKRRYCDENCQRADWEAGHQDFCVGRIEELERLVARRRAGLPDPEPDLFTELGDLGEVPDQSGPWQRVTQQELGRVPDPEPDPEPDLLVQREPPRRPRRGPDQFEPWSSSIRSSTW